MTISDRLSTDELEIRVQERTAELKKANQELSRRNLVLEGINRIFNIVVQDKTEAELGNEYLSLMSENMRHSGIDIIGNMPWGTHFCQFYQTKEDLIDILVPYFKTGLENNEFCMWVTSQPLEVEDAKEALRKAVPDIDVYLEKEQLEIISYSLSNGYDGLRLTGNTFWLEKEDWNDFVNYEKKVDRVLGNYQMIALYTYL